MRSSPHISSDDYLKPSKKITREKKPSSQGLGMPTRYRPYGEDRHAFDLKEAENKNFSYGLQGYLRMATNQRRKINTTLKKYESSVTEKDVPYSKLRVTRHNYFFDKISGKMVIENNILNAWRKAKADEELSRFSEVMHYNPQLSITEESAQPFEPIQLAQLNHVIPLNESIQINTRPSIQGIRKPEYYNPITNDNDEYYVFDLETQLKNSHLDLAAYTDKKCEAVCRAQRGMLHKDLSKNSEVAVTRNDYFFDTEHFLATGSRRIKILKNLWNNWNKAKNIQPRKQPFWQIYRPEYYHLVNEKWCALNITAVLANIKATLPHEDINNISSDYLNMVYVLREKFKNWGWEVDVKDVRFKKNKFKIYVRKHLWDKWCKIYSSNSLDNVDSLDNGNSPTNSPMEPVQCLTSYSQTQTHFTQLPLPPLTMIEELTLTQEEETTMLGLLNEDKQTVADDEASINSYANSYANQLLDADDKTFAHLLERLLGEETMEETKQNIDADVGANLNPSNFSRHITNSSSSPLQQNSIFQFQPSPSTFATTTNNAHLRRSTINKSNKG